MLAAFLTRTGLVLPVGDRESDVLRFEELLREHARALQRLTFGYEASPEHRRDLLQEILVALWRALPSFEARSSLKTWVFRIAHNVSSSHSLRERRRPKIWRSLDDVGELTTSADTESDALSRIRLEALGNTVRELRPLDRQLVLLFLEGFSPREIAEVTGLSDTNVSTKLSRLRAVLRKRVEEGPRHG